MSRRPLMQFGLIAALVLRALIPAGFMPGTAAGAPALVLCTAQGAKVIDGHGAHQQHAQCPFAAAISMAALPGPVPTLPAPAEHSSPAPRLRPAPTQFIVTGFSARGPPSLA